MTRYVVATEDGQFATAMYSDDEPMVFTDLDHARAEQEDQNESSALYMPDQHGPGLVRVRPWKVYELVEVTSLPLPSR